MLTGPAAVTIAAPTTGTIATSPPFPNPEAPPRIPAGRGFPISPLTIQRRGRRCKEDRQALRATIDEPPKTIKNKLLQITKYTLKAVFCKGNPPDYGSSQTLL